MADSDRGGRRGDALAALVDGALLDQQHRMERLRRAQGFVSGPLFPELRDAPLAVSDDPAALAERARELDYRIALLESVLALLREERALVDRAVPTGAVPAGAEPAGAGAEAPDA